MIYTNFNAASPASPKHYSGIVTVPCCWRRPGGWKGDQIAQRIGRSPRFVDEWLARYRSDGLTALTPRKQPGKPPKLTAEQETQLKARLDAGPIDADGGVCTLRGRDVVRILKEEFGVHHTLGSIYGVLGRIGYSCLSPRPRHEQNDPEQLQQFKLDAPFFVRTVSDAIAPYGGKVRVWFMDEPRFGQQGTITQHLGTNWISAPPPCGRHATNGSISMPRSNRPAASRRRSWLPIDVAVIGIAAEAVTPARKAFPAST